MAQNLADRREYLRKFGGAIAGGSALLAGCTGGGGGEFPSEDIRLVIPYSTGGAYDAYGRALSEFLPEYLPNDVEVVPENVTGAGGRTGANTVYRADPDGYTVGFYNIPGMAATQTVEETEYDVTNVSWVSSVASASYILASNPESGLDSVEDFVQNDDTVQIGLTGTGGTSDLVTILSINTLNTNAERITGFEGESEAISAVVRGEVDARFNNISSIWPRIEDGDVTGVVALMDELPEYAADSGIPLITDFDEYASIADFASVHFPIGAPPETDDERVEILEQAIGDAVASEEMTEWSDQNELPLIYSNAAETEETVMSAMETLEGFSDILEEQL